MNFGRNLISENGGFQNFPEMMQRLPYLRTLEIFLNHTSLDESSIDLLSESLKICAKKLESFTLTIENNKINKDHCKSLAEGLKLMKNLVFCHLTFNSNWIENEGIDYIGKSLRPM